MTMTPHILILAAGQGKRMRSMLPKVLHPVLFQPMIHHVLKLSKNLPHASITAVIGHGEKEVREACKDFPEVKYVKQTEQLGTAHAVMQAKDLLTLKSGQLLVLCGDVPLLRLESVGRLLTEHEKSKSSCTVVTTLLDNPTGYGRVLKNAKKQVVAIREEKDASSNEKKVKEINAGIYCFEIPELAAALKNIRNNNEQMEFYLTDVIELLVKAKKKVSTILFEDSSEVMGINDRVALMQAEKILQTRINHEHLLKGVTIHLPETVLIDADTKIESDVEIEPNCVIYGSIIRRGAHLKQGCYIEKSDVGEDTSIGPYAHLRPDCVLGSKVKIGNFVELKKAVMKAGAKASHLSYIGDAEVGKNSNIGCGFVTCNYDGFKKHKTIIEDDVFIGSDSQTVAPVRVGQGAYVASGTTVTQDVPKDALAISRGKQVNKEGYAKRIRDSKK